MAQALTVGEITRRIRDLLENDPQLRNVGVEGEVSNLTRHTSGHIYFTLKDNDAQLSCAMFRSSAQHFYNQLPKNGDRIMVRGDINLYPPQGRYQLIANFMEKAGMGDLHRKFLELKDKLEREGLFAEPKKQPLPRFPSVIGIVTSPTGAVIRDIINTVRRRFPHVKLLLSPASVQGDQAAASIIQALQRLQRRQDVEVIILARGGGSLEDLWCFNDENLARTIAACMVPIISGVGHETDFTIADFVADKRASTPTAAAEMVVPDSGAILQFLDDSEVLLKRNLRHFIDFRRQMVDDYESRLVATMERLLDDTRRELEEHESNMLGVIEWQISDTRHELDSLGSTMYNSLQRSLDGTRHELDLLEAKLQALDMTETLRRGFTVTTFGKQRLTKLETVTEGDIIETHFAEGSIESEVKKIKTP